MESSQTSSLLVTKHSSQQEPFSEEKVIRSMNRVGVPAELEPLVLQHIKERLRPNIPTSEIFYHILEFLKQKDTKASLRFNLKQAIFDLGPTGFPFERYIERIFQRMGYATQVDIILPGECVTHEIDLLIEKNDKKEIIEAKFHNHAGTKTEIHVALYTFARFLDVKEKNRIENVWIITNTKLSNDAIRYAQCKNINVVAWNYPEKGNLQDFVEHPSMYPITILTMLTKNEHQELFARNIVLCHDLLLLSEKEKSALSIDHNKLEAASESARVICES